MAYLKLLLMRHAQSLGNLQGQMEGQSSTALSAEGHCQAQRLCHVLMQSALMQSALPTHLYSSPLLRAIQTTQYLSDALQQLSHEYASQQMASLQEMHQGIFQGLTWAQAQAHYPELCAQLLSSLTWQPVPQAESLTEARVRAEVWMKSLFCEHQPGDVVWAISHEGFLQQLIAVVLGCDRTWKIAIAPTAIFEFWLKPPTDSFRAERFNPERWILRRFNDYSHLDDGKAM